MTAWSKPAIADSNIGRVGFQTPVAGLRSVTAEFGTATVVPATMIKPVAAITDFRNLPRIFSSYRPFP
ncbi:MAG TPA: hypothetical protein VMS82_13360, partial [Pseudolabrys sp.]|nr:hypothetical protein [Pseudolabrys sp.]